MRGCGAGAWWASGGGVLISCFGGEIFEAGDWAGGVCRTRGCGAGVCRTCGDGVLASSFDGEVAFTSGVGFRIASGSPRGGDTGVGFGVEISRGAAFASGVGFGVVTFAG